MIVDLDQQPPPSSWGVTVDDQAVDDLATAWADRPMPLPAFDYPGTPVERHEDWWYTYVILSVSVLACLWPPEGEEMWATEFGGIWLDDAPGIFATFTRHVGPHGLDLAFFADLDDDAGPALFTGRGHLQLLPERIDTLRRAATTLIERWDGNATNLVAEAESGGVIDAVAVTDLLTETMPGYRDRPASEVGVLPFDKLSHLAAAIMTAGLGWNFTNYEDFWVYPDYMLPRVLRYYGVLRYDNNLAAAVDNRRLVAADSEQEHAIRWATVYAGARLRAALASRGNRVSGPGLDYHLWSQAVLRPKAVDFGEHHRTLTMRY
ncbi:MAG: queuosine salvage family protein [Acidimicrobiia bacterium]|nr:queuosine salvage family protein [Acidimicrobiia bacterium]